MGNGAPCYVASLSLLAQVLEEAGLGPRGRADSVPHSHSKLPMATAWSHAWLFTELETGSGRAGERSLPAPPQDLSKQAGGGHVAGGCVPPTFTWLHSEETELFLSPLCERLGWAGSMQVSRLLSEGPLGCQHNVTFIDS